jgi:hypothetical protein
MVENRVIEDPPPSNGESDSKDLFWKWLWNHPLLIVIIAHCIFSIGIWNAQSGFGEDTVPVMEALHSTQSPQVKADLYVNVLTVILNGVTSDPVKAVVLMRFLASLLAVVGLYLILSCFSDCLRQGTILFACFVWTASCLNAPAFQSTSTSSFTFGIMSIAIYCILRKWTVASFVGFYYFGLIAASLRPEYMAPIILITLLLIGAAMFKCTRYIESSIGITRLKSRLGCLLLAVTISILAIIRPSHGVSKKMEFCDRYLLFGLGQCYADFYHKEHPSEVFDAMTEYTWLLNKQFKQPTSFLGALKNNPREAMRYFVLNSIENLKSIPKQLLITRNRGDVPMDVKLYKVVLGVLLAGGALGVIRVRRFYINFLSSERRKGHMARLGAFLEKHIVLFRRLLILLLLTSASSAAVIMLVGTPRYWISIVPLLYLGLAFSCDSLLTELSLVRFEPLIVAASFIGFCRPNFIIPKPNLEVQALRHIAPLIRPHPVIGAWWALPDCIFAFRGEAKDISISDGIKAEDIVEGRFDVLMIDNNFRATATWANQLGFFENFEQEPQKYSFKKITEIPTDRFNIYYRPVKPGS